MSRPPIDGGVVLVTGASSGIGAAFARQLAPRARVLVLVARRVERLEALAEELRAARPGLVVEVRRCDLADVDATRALAAALPALHGGVDVLVNNAGLGDIAFFEGAPPAKLEQMVLLNVLAPTLLARAALPGMLARGRGGILNVSSGLGLSWLPAFAVYGGTKHYLSAWSEALRAELAGTGVVVTTLAPGPVATEFEAVAGNPSGRPLPGFVQLSAEDCARAGLAAFDRGRARVVPPWWLPLALAAGQATPIAGLRLLYGALARVGRRRLPTLM